MYNVVGDGSCGFRSVAIGIGQSENTWPEIRQNLLQELDQHAINYTAMWRDDGFQNIRFTVDHFEPGFAPREKWMSMPNTGCGLVRDIANKVLSWWNLDHANLNSYAEWKSWLVSIRMDSKLKKMFEGGSKRPAMAPVCMLVVIIEYLVKISKKTRILELKRRHLKITILPSNTPYPSRKIRRMCACTSQKTTKETRSIRRIWGRPIRRIQCLTRCSTKVLFTSFKEPKREFQSSRKLLKTLSLDESRSPEFNLFSDLEEYSKEDVAETIAETMEQYMSKTRADYGSGIARPKIIDKDSFELKGQFLKELRNNTFSGSDHEDANEHIEKVLEIVDLFHISNITQHQVMLRAFLMIRSTKTFNGLAAIQAQLNNLRREIKKVNEKVYTSQIRCKQCKGPHYTKDCPLKEEGKTLEEAYYTQFSGSFQGGEYRVAAPGFYQRNNANPSYQERRKSMEETMSKFMSESAKRHEENSNMIKEIRASTDEAVRNQRALIKSLEIQIEQISKVLQERGFGSLHSSTEANLRDHVKLISTTAEADSNLIRRI
ncbi:DNA-directed DNA polymerase [Tanacetum coccineum]